MRSGRCLARRPASQFAPSVHQLFDQAVVFAEGEVRVGNPLEPSVNDKVAAVWRPWGLFLAHTARSSLAEAFVGAEVPKRTLRVAHLLQQAACVVVGVKKPRV
jgi:hypothetical protein